MAPEPGERLAPLARQNLDPGSGKTRPDQSCKICDRRAAVAVQRSKGVTGGKGTNSKGKRLCYTQSRDQDRIPDAAPFQQFRQAVHAADLSRRWRIIGATWAWMKELSHNSSRDSTGRPVTSSASARAKGE